MGDEGFKLGGLYVHTDGVWDCKAALKNEVTLGESTNIVVGGAGTFVAVASFGLDAGESVEVSIGAFQEFMPVFHKYSLDSKALGVIETQIHESETNVQAENYNLISDELKAVDAKVGLINDEVLLRAQEIKAVGDKLDACATKTEVAAAKQEATGEATKAIAAQTNTLGAKIETIGEKSTAAGSRVDLLGTKVKAAAEATYCIAAQTDCNAEATQLTGLVSMM
ncbi:MAG: hypothetical protein WCJ37_15115 [Syntrophus sp. (in: bacteria)]